VGVAGLGEGVNDRDLRQLVEVAKSKPRMRFLVCNCGLGVELKNGVYLCSAGHETKSLRELAVKGEKR